LGQKKSYESNAYVEPLESDLTLLMRADGTTREGCPRDPIFLGCCFCLAGFWPVSWGRVGIRLVWLLSIPRGFALG